MAWGGRGGYRFDLRQGAGQLPGQDCESLVAPYNARAERWYSTGAGGATTQLLGFPVEIDPDAAENYGPGDLLSGVLECDSELDLIRAEVERARKELAAKEAALARGEDISRWTSSWQLDEAFRGELARLRRRQQALGARGPELLKRYEQLDLERERLRQLQEEMEEEEAADRARRRRDFEKLEGEHRRRLEKMEEDLADWEEKLKARKEEIEAGLRQAAAYPPPQYPQHPYPPPGPAAYQHPPPPAYAPAAAPAAAPVVAQPAGVPGGALPASLPLQLEQNQEALSFLALGLLGGKRNKRKSKDPPGPILPPKPPQPAVAWVVDWKAIPDEEDEEGDEEEKAGEGERPTGDGEAEATAATAKEGAEKEKEKDEAAAGGRGGGGGGGGGGGRGLEEGRRPRGISAEAARRRMERSKSRAEALREAAKEAEETRRARREAEAARKQARSPPPKTKPMWTRKPSPPPVRIPPDREFGRDAKGLPWRAPARRDASELTGRSNFLPTSVAQGVTTAWAVRAA